MHQVQVDIVHAEILEGGGNAILDPVVPGIVQLSGDPDLVAGHARVANTRTDLGFVAVGQGSIDVTVALQQGVLDGLTDFIGLGLPGSQADGGDLITGVEGIGLSRKEEGVGLEIACAAECSIERGMLTWCAGWTLWR